MKKRIDEIYVLRAMACLSVILVHLSAEPVVTLKRSYILSAFTLLNRAVQYTTPAFIFISAFLLFYIYKDKDFKYFSFLKKRLSTILIPYFIWTIIYYAYFIYKGYYTFSVSFFIKNLMLAKMCYHLYFILTITQFYLLFVVFRFLYKKYNPHLLVILSLIINVLFMKYIYFKYVDRFFMQYLFYFSFGCYVATNIDYFRGLLYKWKYVVFTMHGGIIIYYSYQFYQYQTLKKSVNGYLVNMTWFVFSFLAILSLYLIGVMISKKSKFIFGICKQVSDASYYIYLSHPLILIISNGILNRLGIISIFGRFVLNFIIVLGTVVPSSIVYFNVKKKTMPLIKSKLGLSKYKKFKGILNKN